MSRLKELRIRVDRELMNMENESKRNSAFVHLYGVSLAAAMIAEKRQENTELACMAAMLHDIAAYKTGSYEDHAHRGADMARSILEELAITNQKENDIICSAIYHHDDKLLVDSPMDEVLKDADVIHHTMNDPSKMIKDKEAARFRALRIEFGIDPDSSEDQNSDIIGASGDSPASAEPGESKNSVFRAMRRFKQQIDQQACDDILTNGKRGVLSLIGDGGYPYGVPVNFYYDKESRRIFIHSARKGHKIDAIRSCDKVCFTVWQEDYQNQKDGWSWHLKSVIAMGRASLMKDDDPEKLDMTRLFGRKYYPDKEEVEVEIQKDFHRMNLIEIRVEHMTGKTVHEK